MVMFNGTSSHVHTITDFKMTGSPTKKGITTTYNGSATIAFRPGFLLPVPFVTDVPISIKLMGPSAMSVWIDPTTTREHFGNTPIYGVQHGMPIMYTICNRSLIFSAKNSFAVLWYVSYLTVLCVLM